MDAKLRFKISHAVTEHDRKEQEKASKSPRGYYNHYALALYLKGVQDAETLVDNGATIRFALVSCFNGSLLNKVLKAVGEPRSTKLDNFNYSN